jgi:hypothetical protein
MTEYTLRYCYKYEPGFAVYQLLDLVLYATEGPDTHETARYIMKEHEFIDEEDKHQMFFVVKRFIFSEDPRPRHFLKVALYPKEPKESHVLNLVYAPLIKPWESYTVEEQDRLVKEIVWEQEREIIYKYKVTEVEGLELYVENVDDVGECGDIMEDHEVCELLD